MNLLYIQSGGPTAVINCSMYGVIQSSRMRNEITSLIGARNGIHGAINENFIDLFSISGDEVERLKNTPSMSLGSCRYVLQDTEYRKFISILRKKKIDGIIFNGGNGTAKFCERLIEELDSASYPCKVVLVPKTVDNDLSGIDFSPGFLSAANYVVTTIRELSNDMQVYDSNLILIVEVMGRDSGWLAAATKIANKDNYGPDLIYVPEITLDFSNFIADVKTIYHAKGKCLIVVSEGVRNKNSKYIFEENLEDPDNVILGMSGASNKLASLLRENFPCKVRTIDLNLMQRCSIHLASSIEKHRAELLGRFAVKKIIEQKTDVMVTIDNHSELTTTSISSIVNIPHNLPLKYINSEGNNINLSYCSLIEPFLNPMINFVSFQ